MAGEATRKVPSQWADSFWAAAGLFALALVVALVILPADGASRARAAQADAVSEHTLRIGAR